MSLPNELYHILESRLDVRIKYAVSVSGGMVSQAAKVVTDSGPIFVKWKLPPGPRAPDADAGVNAPDGVGTNRRPAMFESEADGLARLRATGVLRVPDVLAFRDAGDSDEGQVPFLALEWLETRSSGDTARFTENFAAGLSTLHRTALSPNGQFGLDRDNFLGRRLQVNAWNANWAAFYRDCRIRPMIAMARDVGRLSPAREQRLEALAEHVPDLLPAGDPPCLVHGDLWSGNFLQLGDRAALIDPAVYYANREVELAYVHLFGGFPRGFFEAYHSYFPVDPGYGDRRPLLQLYPLLVHLISFGEDYGPAVEAVCSRYGYGILT